MGPILPAWLKIVGQNDLAREDSFERVVIDQTELLRHQMVISALGNKVK